MITGVQQYNSTNFTAKLPTKKVVNAVNKVAKAPKMTEESFRVLDMTGLDKAIDELFENVSKNPKQVMKNIKLVGKALKEGFKVNWNFYFQK